MKILEPTIFIITKEEINNIFLERIEQGNISNISKINNKTIISTLSSSEGDEFLCNDMRY